MKSFSRFPTIWSLCAIVCLLAAAPAFSQTEDKAKLIEGAKKEGKLIWYTSTNITESKPLLDDFEKQYPFVKGEIFRASGEKTLNRIVTEARANRSEFDIVTISEVDALIEAKLLAPYRSPEAQSFIPQFKDPNGNWTAVYINYTTIGYNPKMISEKDAPKQWEDLLEPKWKGKFSIDQEQYPWFGTLHKAWGRERAQKYMRAIAKQDVQWRKGHTLIAQLMTAGEFPAGVIYAHRVEEMKQRGAPIEWVSTVNPIVVTVNAAGLSIKPQHPNTAKLFYDFLMSKPAQQRLRTLRRIPARPDIEPFSPRMEQSKLKLQVEPSQTGPQFNQTIKEFREIFGI